MERKNFEPWKVALVYRRQDGVCAKLGCLNPLEGGFHRHHKDGNPSNDSIENLELYCPICHGGEAYRTLIEQKKQALGQVEAMIQMSLEGKLSGAAADKLLDAIRLQLSLSRQVYGTGVEEPPAEIRAEGYLASSGILIKEYEKGFRDGFQVVRFMLGEKSGSNKANKT